VTGLANNHRPFLVEHQSLDHCRIERNAIPGILGFHVSHSAVYYTPLNQQRASWEIEIPPLKCNDFADAQAQAACYQHHRPVRLGNRFSIVLALESMWTYLASRIFPLAAGLASCGAIIQFAFNRPGYLRLVACAGGFLTVSALWLLVNRMM
jgi:hypothetical protein